MSAKKKVLENSFFYVFSSLLVRAIGFLLLPVYTLFLSPEDYGITNLVNNFIQVTTFIIAFSLYSAAIRFYVDFKEDKERLKSFYGTIITFIIISGSFFLSFSLIIRYTISTLFFEGINFYPIVFIALVSMTFISLHTMHQSILQGIQQGKKLTIINLTVFGLTIILKLYFIGILRLGAVGFLLAQLIINVAYFIFMIYDLNKNELFKLTIDFRILRESLKYSIPLMPHNLSTKVASFVSRVFINVSGSLVSVGLYSVAMHFGNLIDVIQTSVNKAFQPWFYEMMSWNDPKSRKDAVDLSYSLLIFYSFIYMVIGLFSQEVVILMTNEQYLMAWTVIPILIVGFSVKSIYYFFVNIVMYYKQAARILFLATITGSFVDIILAYFLVSIYGIHGAAIAFALAKIVVVCIVVLISKRFDNVGYKVTKMLSIILPSLFFMGVGLYFSYTKYLTVFSWGNLAYKILILIAYVLFIYITNKNIIDNVFKSGQVQKILRIEGRKKQ